MIILEDIENKTNRITMLLEDTRQQESKHIKKHNYFRSQGIHWSRTALYCGDYTLPTNQSVCIDTKKNLNEIIGDIHCKKMPKRDIWQKIYDTYQDNKLDFDSAEEIYHAICDDDSERFPEREIEMICHKSNLVESAESQFKELYVKRHGFFHRGLIRAKNSEIHLIILIENEYGINDISDLFNWQNPRIQRYNKIKVAHDTGKMKNVKLPKAPPTTGEQLAKAMLTMENKYGCRFLFCMPEESGSIIAKLLSG